MVEDPSKKIATIGVLALQGAFREHLQLLRSAATQITSPYTLTFTLIKTAEQLSQVAALIIPGGESTTIALIAERTGLLEPLRDFVKVSRRPTWGTCAGMILLSESANRTKKGGQELIGGLDVRINRNHFGRQVESFTTPLALKFLGENEPPFMGVFIRAPVVGALLPKNHTIGEEQMHAPSKRPAGEVEKAFLDEGRVQVLAELLRAPLEVGLNDADMPDCEAIDLEREIELQSGDLKVVAVKQGNVMGTSFHPELTGDVRMHKWWLERVVEDLRLREELCDSLEL